VAQLFRFYPLREAPFYEPLDTEAQGASGAWPTSYEEAIPLSKKAKAWVNLVKRQMGLGVTDGAVKEWFGKFDTSTKSGIMKILNSAASILGNVRFSYPGHSCIEPSVGYVFPKGKKCVGSLIAKECRVDATGKPIIYLCPPWRAISSSTWMMKQKIEIITAWSLYHKPALTENFCTDRTSCAALATTDTAKAMKSNANHKFFIASVADSAYSETYRCSLGSRSLTAFRDRDGDCKCGVGSTCTKGGAACPYSKGMSYTYFSGSCTNCKCSVSTTSRCSASAVSSYPDSDGDCKCPGGKVCYTAGSKYCRSSFSLQTHTYFSSTCSSCHCVKESLLTQGLAETSDTFSYEDSTAILTKAAKWVQLTKDRLDETATTKAVKEWFGKDDKQTRAEMRDVLDTVSATMKNVRFEYPGHQCVEPDLGYVYPHGITCSGSLVGKKCQDDADGKKIIFLCPPWRMIGTMTEHIEIVAKWSLSHLPAERVKVCDSRSACAALATTNTTGAIKSVDNFLLFIEAVADPTLSESFRCPTSAGPLEPFSDSKKDCKCPAATTCQKGDLPCPTSFGHSHSQFAASCSDCKCIANDRENDGDRSQPLVVPPSPASDSEMSSIGMKLVYVSGAVVAFLLVAGAAIYLYRERCRKKTRRIAADMEFQEAFQTQQAPVRV